jgi:hypothetical protein
LLHRHPEDPTVALLYARHLLRTHAVDEAAALLATPLASPVADALRGELARQHGDFEGATTALGRALGPELGLDAGWVCGVCGAAATRWEVRCSHCRRWNALAATTRAVLGAQDSSR